MSRSRALLDVDETRVPQMLREPQRPQMVAPPRSALLGRLATFLPQIEASNAQMEQNEPTLVAEDDFDESADEAATPGDVEMDLYCGIMAAPAADAPITEHTVRIPGGPSRPDCKRRGPGAGIVEL